MFGADSHAVDVHIVTVAAKAMGNVRNRRDLVGDTVDTGLDQSGRREAPIPHSGIPHPGYSHEYQVFI